MRDEYDTILTSIEEEKRRFKSVMSFMDRAFLVAVPGSLVLLFFVHDAMFTVLLWFTAALVGIFATAYLAPAVTCRFISTVYRAVSPKMGSRRRAEAILSAVDAACLAAQMLAFGSFFAYMVSREEADIDRTGWLPIFMWMFCVGISLFSGILERILEED